MWRGLWAERGIGPGRATVGADLDAGDRRRAGPRATRQLHGPRVEDACARQERRESGRHHQAAHPDPFDRCPGVRLGVAEAVTGDVLIAHERGLEHPDAGEPLHVRHPVPARDDQAKREAVLRRQRLAVHLVGEEQVRSARLGERESALVVLLDVALDAVIQPGERDVDGASQGFRLRQQRRERGPGPRRGSDRAAQPGLADRARFQERPSVARTLECHDGGDRGPVAKLLERQCPRTCDVPVDRQSERSRVDVGDVVVGQEIVQTDRRDVGAERLVRHSVVPRRQIELVDADPCVVSRGPLHRSPSGRRPGYSRWPSRRLGTRDPV